MLMSESKNDEIIAKYFDKVYYTQQFSTTELITLVDPIITKAINAIDISVENKNKLFGEIKEENNTIVELLKSKLNSIRKIKKFDKAFSRNLKKIRNDIYLPDIIIITLVEVTRWELFDFIRKYQNDLSVSPNETETVSSLLVFSQFDTLLNKYKTILSQSYLDEDDKKILYYFFPHIKTTIDFQPDTQLRNISSFRSGYFDVYKEIERKRRLAHFLLISKFFTTGSISDNISRLTSQDYKEEILNALANEKFDLEYTKKQLSILFPEGSYNLNIRRISLNWVTDIVTTNENFVISKNMLISISFVARSFSNQSIGFLGLSEKKSASFLTWDYIKRKDADQNILLTILSYTSNSDTFADTILFYSITPDRSIVKLPSDLIAKVVVSYVKRIELKLDKAKSIFNSEYFDDINISIWRWNQAINYCTKNDIKITTQYDIKSHIVSNTQSVSKNFELLIQYSFEDYGDDDIYFKPESIASVIDDENLISLTEIYLNRKNFIDLDERRIKALNKWYNQYKKS